MENTDSVNELHVRSYIIISPCLYILGSKDSFNVHVQTSIEYAFEICKFKHGWWKA